MSKAIGILALLWTGMLCAGVGNAQETVNGSPVVMGTLKTAGAQSAVDFTAAGTTAPVKTGLLAARPSTCTPGQMYFATDAAAGQNLYLCTATAVWSLGTGGSGGSSPGGSSGGVQTNNGSGGFAGQPGIYSALYNGGSEYQQAENCLKGIVVPYTVFTTASTSQQVTIANMPSSWSPRVVQVEESGTFTSGSGQVTALATSVGTLSNPAYYLQPLAVMQSAPNFRSDDAGGQAAQLTSHAVYLQLSVTNANPGSLGNGTTTNLTAGQLTVRVCGVTLQ